LQGGPRDLAVAGWTTFLIGLLVLLVGSIVLTAALVRRDLPAALAAGFVAVTLVLWPGLLATGQDALAVAGHLAAALGWLVLASRIQMVTCPRVPISA
jgi:hypothetical protein